MQLESTRPSQSALVRPSRVWDSCQAPPQVSPRELWQALLRYLYIFTYQSEPKAAVLSVTAAFWKDLKMALQANGGDLPEHPKTLKRWAYGLFSGRSDFMKRRAFLKGLGLGAVGLVGEDAFEHILSHAILDEAITPKKSLFLPRHLGLRFWLNRLLDGELLPGRTLTARDLEGYPLTAEECGVIAELVKHKPELAHKHPCIHRLLNYGTVLRDKVILPPAWGAACEEIRDMSPGWDLSPVEMGNLSYVLSHLDCENALAQKAFMEIHNNKPGVLLARAQGALNYYGLTSWGDLVDEIFPDLTSGRDIGPWYRAAPARMSQILHQRYPEDVTWNDDREEVVKRILKDVV